MVFSPLVSAQVGGTGPAAPRGQGRAQGILGLWGTRALGTGGSGIVGDQGSGCRGFWDCGGPELWVQGVLELWRLWQTPFCISKPSRVSRRKGPLLECPPLSESK